MGKMGNMSKMGKLKAKATGTKAEVEAKKAAAEAKAAIADVGRASRDLATALTEAVRSSQLDDRALELADRLRDTEAYARGAGLAATTSKKVRDAHLDQRALELAALLKSSDLATRLKASEMAAKAQKSSEDALGRAGVWLASGHRASCRAVRGRRSGATTWLFATLGVLVGYAVGAMTAPRRGADLRDEMAFSAQRLMHDTPSGDATAQTAAGPASAGPASTGQQAAGQQMGDIPTPPSQKTIADKIRTHLGEDPRTSSLPRLNVNVAEGTAFIRGTVPPGFDQAAIREIAAAVEGVTDVDLQVTVTA